MLSAILVSIFRSSLGDCTNGGVTGGAVKDALLLIPGPRGNYTHAEALAAAERGEVVLRLVTRWAGTPNEYTHCEPVLSKVKVTEQARRRVLSPMMGGNFVHSCDARFPNRYPLPVHDRFETPAQYAANFD